MTPTDSQVASIIDESFLFKTLKPETKEKVRAIASMRSFAAGEKIITEGETGLELFIVASGKVEVRTQTTEGDLQLAELGPGAMIGEVAVFTDAPRTSTVSALEPTQTVTFQRDDIRELANSFPRFGKLVERIIQGRARHTISMIPGAPE
jgi:CRP-like cAMP-binding protein